MLQQEPYEKNIFGQDLIRIYSDEGKPIVENETGIIYDEVIDVPFKHTYRELEENQEQLEENQEETSEQEEITLIDRLN